MFESGSDGVAQAWLDKILAILFMKASYRLLSTAYSTSDQGGRVGQRRKCYILTLLVFKVSLFTISVCMDVFVCVSMHHEHARCSQRSGDSTGFSRMGVTDNRELPCGCWESNQVPQEEQPVLLALNHHSSHLKICFKKLYLRVIFFLKNKNKQTKK